MLSVGSNHPVDPLTIAASRAIGEAARALNLPYFLAGAMARDIVLTNVFGINTGRASIDVDFAVAVGGWDEFTQLKNQLINTGLFNAPDNTQHRLHYRLPGMNTGHPVDIIPFRGVENPPQTIKWPPERAVIMNVIGYEEALAHLVEVQVDQSLTVPVASLPGLALLKLFAWRDRNALTPKDARDFAVILRNYANAGNQDRIYGEEIALLEAVDYDFELASARLLGKDVRTIARITTVTAANSLFDNTQILDRLLTHMAPAFNTADDNVAAAENALKQFTLEFIK